MNQSVFPEGWDEERVRRVISHYEGQTEEEALLEDGRHTALMEIPVELIPAVRSLIAGQRAADKKHEKSPVLLKSETKRL